MKGGVAATVPTTLARDDQGRLRRRLADACRRAASDLDPRGRVRFQSRYREVDLGPHSDPGKPPSRTLRRRRPRQRGRCPSRAAWAVAVARGSIGEAVAYIAKRAAARNRAGLSLIVHCDSAAGVRAWYCISAVPAPAGRSGRWERLVADGGGGVPEAGVGGRFAPPDLRCAARSLHQAPGSRVLRPPAATQLNDTAEDRNSTHRATAWIAGTRHGRNLRLPRSLQPREGRMSNAQPAVQAPRPHLPRVLVSQHVRARPPASWGSSRTSETPSFFSAERSKLVELALRPSTPAPREQRQPKREQRAEATDSEAHGIPAGPVFR